MQKKIKNYFETFALKSSFFVLSIIGFKNCVKVIDKQPLLVLLFSSNKNVRWKNERSNTSRLP